MVACPLRENRGAADSIPGYDRGRGADNNKDGWVRQDHAEWYEYWIILLTKAAETTVPPENSWEDHRKYFVEGTGIYS